jgi:hypothetical protein
MADAEMTETQDYDKSADPTDHASNHESGGSDPIDNLGPLTGLTISGDGVISWQGASLASKYLFDTRVSGDTHPRFRIRADGKMEWGSGSSSPESTLTRTASNYIQSSFTITFVYGGIQCIGSAATSFPIQIKTGFESHYKFSVTQSGNLEFGSGSSVRDCLIYRRAANILNTPDRFEFGTLGVANSANATTPGSCQKKVEIFDSAGNSLGFVAVYDAIT